MGTRRNWTQVFAAAMVGALLGLCIAPIGNAWAQGAPIVQEIRVEGNQRVEPETVLSYMSLAVGDPMAAANIDDSLKALFATGLFADVVIGQDGGALIVRVVENPVINRIAFEGNRQLSDEALTAELQLRPRVVFTRSRVQSDVQRLIQIYQRSGRFAIRIEPKVIQLEQNRVDLVFEVTEGPLTGVRRIRFIGNRQFSDSDLRGVIVTTETRFWKFITTNDNYDPDRMAFDQELLRQFYATHGYADFRVVSAVAQLTPDGQDFFITFTIEEGAEYQFGEIAVESQIGDLDTTALRELVQGTPGEVFNASLIEDSILDLTFEVGTVGFAFVDIRPQFSRDREARTIDVKYIIGEGPRVYVDRINIQGNVRTLDEVIRREFRISEGDAFNTAKVQRSIQRVRGLGFFDDVAVAQRPADAAAGGVGQLTNDRIILDMAVREKSTGSLGFGFGFSTTDQFLADISVNEANLLGRGQDISLALTVASRRQQIDLSFTEPYFLNRNIAAGFDIFTIRNDLQDQSSFSESSRGFSLRAGLPLAERLSMSFSYTLRRDTVKDIGVDASSFVRQQEGSRTISAVGYAVLLDRRDDSFFPTEGYSVRVSQEFAGLGGTVRYLRTTAQYQTHYPLENDWIASFLAEGGVITGFGRTLNISDRFFVGGNNFRGFGVAGIGPRDADTKDALGGKVFYLGTAEVSFPMPFFPEDLEMRASMFVDAGGLAKPGVSGDNLLAGTSLRATYGVGLLWLSPIGPLRLDFAASALKESYDITEGMRFSFGGRF
ncbi:MAG: outer membrane protein assembly factor BamA [Alphaproteobacteria bacterium]|nr:outer membrane protein assembly factor BamA [Alphaproteobacteria bacterium]MBT4711592.1 outer membrane protein assembly factor BamA [Alphaproteobacteria bacterium]